MLKAEQKPIPSSQLDRGPLKREMVNSTLPFDILRFTSRLRQKRYKGKDLVPITAKTGNFAAKIQYL